MPTMVVNDGMVVMCKYWRFAYGWATCEGQKYQLNLNLFFTHLRVIFGLTFFHAINHFAKVRKLELHIVLLLINNCVTEMESQAMALRHFLTTKPYMWKSLSNMLKSC